MSTPGEGQREALKPCPFCGGPAELRRGNVTDAWVVCNYGPDDICGVETRLFDTPSEAIAAWNRRADVADIRSVAYEIGVVLDVGAHGPKPLPREQVVMLEKWRARLLRAGADVEGPSEPAKREIEAFRAHLEKISLPVQLATRAVVNRAREVAAKVQKGQKADRDDYTTLFSCGPLYRLAMAVEELSRQEDKFRGREPYRGAAPATQEAPSRDDKSDWAPSECPACGVELSIFWDEAGKLASVQTTSPSAPAEPLEAEIARLRLRLFGMGSVAGHAHSTGCSMWGDDGQGGTKEGFREPLPCNCGCLINWHRDRADAAEVEVERLRAALSVSTSAPKETSELREWLLAPSVEDAVEELAEAIRREHGVELTGRAAPIGRALDKLRAAIKLATPEPAEPREVTK